MHYCQDVVSEVHPKFGAAHGNRVQRADIVEADRAACGAVAGAAQAAALSDHQHGRAHRRGCAEDAAGAGRAGRPHRFMEGGHATATGR